MKLIKTTSPYQRLQGECLSGTIKLGTNQRGDSRVGRAGHGCWAVHERAPKGLPILSSSAEQGPVAEELSAHCMGKCSEAKPGRRGGISGAPYMCSVERVTQEPITQMLITHRPAEPKSETTPLWLGWHLVGTGKLKGSPASTVGPGHPRAEDATPSQRALRDMSQGGYADSSFPGIQTAECKPNLPPSWRLINSKPHSSHGKGIIQRLLTWKRRI